MTLSSSWKAFACCGVYFASAYSLLRLPGAEGAADPRLAMPPPAEKLARKPRVRSIKPLAAFEHEDEDGDGPEEEDEEEDEVEAVPGVV